MRLFLRALLAVGAFAINGVGGLHSQERFIERPPLPIGKLAFASSESFGRSGAIYVLSGEERKKTQSFHTRELEFLPDGKRIIYSANDFAARGLHLYDLENHVSTPLLKNIEDAESPSLSPDGTRIAFVLYPEGRKSSQIHTANVDGSGMIQLTEGESYHWSPRWSPNGRQLLFETTRNDNPVNHVKNGGHRDIYVMDADGRNQTNLTEAAYGHAPSWSPDGKQIAYMAARGIWVMNADGSAKKNISRAKTRDSEPAWSPDGQWIAFTRTSDKQTMDIWIMKTDGTEQRQVTFDEVNAASYSPSWSR
jgi:TolB protein